MTKSLKRLFEFSIGPIISSIIGFITIPIISYLITPLEFGKVSMFTLMQTILTVMVYVGMDQSYSRFYNEYKDKEKVLFNSIIVPFIISIVLIFILCINSSSISFILFGSIEYVKVVYLLAFSIPFMIIERFILLSIRMEERAKLYSIIIAMMKIVTFVLTLFYILVISKDFLSIVYSQIIGQIFIGIALTILFKKTISLKLKLFEYEMFKKIFKFGFPLLFVSIITWGVNSTDKIFLRIYSNYEQLGIYNMAFKITNLLLIIQTCFTTYWIPMAYRWKKENIKIKKYQEVTDIVTLIMVSVFIIILLFKPIVKIIVSSSYIECIYVLPFLLIYPIVYCIGEVTGLGITFSNRTYLNLIISTLTIFFNICLDFLFIPEYGAIGASVATGISYMIYFWFKTIVSKKLNFNISTNKLIKTSILIILLSSINTFVRTQIIITYIINLTSLVLIAFIYRDNIRKIIELKNNIFSKKDVKFL